MKKLIPIVFLLLICMLPASALAQSELTLAQVNVGLWPEYDRQAMLVIYHIQLPPDTPLPVNLSLHIPASAGEPNAVAELVDEVLVNIPYELETQGAWTAVNIQAESLAVQLEYYDPALVISGAARSFSYSWPGDYEVESMTIEVQQPPTAEDMQLEPTFTTAQAGNDGLTYYSLQVGALAQGETFTQSLAYNKGDDMLTATWQANRQQAGFSFDWRWLLIAAALALVAYGIIGMIGMQGKMKRRPKRTVTAKSVAFCPSCGVKAHKGDQFCRQCGARLRR